jgi:putative transposase
LSATISPASAKPYGVERVCAIWEQPRSSFYAWRRNNDSAIVEPAPPEHKRGPKTNLTDTELLGKIQADLERSPFEGEGHRKVWAPLRVVDEVRVSRKRVLRIMRENRLLSPYRCRKPTGAKHTGTITTEAPNVMWGTNGTRILTVEDGYVWLFSAVEHWSAECVGWHVVKRGTRYAALEPVSMALTTIYGGVRAGVARGLSLRMDHGTQYLADHFLKQVRFWGIQPSFAFVSEPPTKDYA